MMFFHIKNYDVFNNIEYYLTNSNYYLWVDNI